MAWNISKTKRQALVKLQLRDKDGKFIEMGGGVKWYSSRLKKVVAGTVVGSKGENALVRLNKENPTHEPALVSVPAASIQAIDGKASLSPKGEPSADQTPEFEKPEAVADIEADPNAEADSDHESQLKGPQHLATNYGITETSDGNTYITRNDGESIYSPARALKVGDELISPAGADPTKPFSIGRGWATKGTERLNKDGEGPVIGKVIAISENRYAVVQMAGGHTIPDRRNPDEMTDTVTVGLSNQVILATMGLKDALGDRVSSQTYAERPSDEEKEVAVDAPEAQSDHEGREVPEDQLEDEPATDPAARTEQQLEIARSLPVGGFVVADDGSQKFTKTASNQWNFSGGQQLIDDASMVRMVQRGEAEGKKYKAGTDDDSVDAPESAPEATEAPEAQPTPEAPAEQAPEAVEEAPEDDAPAEEAPEAPEEAPQAKATPVNDIVDGLAELEQAAEDIEDSGLEDEEAEEVLNGASFGVVGNDGAKLNVTAEKDENGDWNFVVADENGAEVSSHIIGSEENRVIAEKIAKGSAEPAKEEAAPVEEAAPAAPEAEAYNENGLTAQEQAVVNAFPRMIERAERLGDFEKADKLSDQMAQMVLKGNERLAAGEGQSETPAEKPETAPVSAPEPEKAPEVTPEPAKPVEDAPAPSLVEPDAAPEAPAPTDAEIIAKRNRRIATLDEMPEGSEIFSDDGEQQKFVKVRGGKWAFVSADNQLIDSKSVVGMVERGEASGRSYKGHAPSDLTDAPEAPEAPEKPLLNGEEGYVPIDGRGMKSKQDAKAASDAKAVPFGISMERRPDGLDHAVASRPEAFTPAEAEEFRKLDIELTWAQHENRSGREATVRGKLKSLDRRVNSRLDTEAMARHKNDGPAPVKDSVEKKAPEAAKEAPKPAPPKAKEASESAPEPEATPEEAPEEPAAIVVDPNANDDGLLPDEAERLTALETRLANSYSPHNESDEPVEPLEREINELLEHGEARNRGEEVGPFEASEAAPDYNAAPESTPEAAPAQDSQDPPEAPEAPAAEAPATRRARGSEDIPVADADGNMITRGDKVGHPTLGPVEITKTIPGSGRVEFIDPTTGRKKSVKAARVRKIDPNTETDPTEQPTTATPGERFVDAATGKQGFGDKDGNRVLVGDRVSDATGNEGTVVSVYTAASGGAWIPVKWDSDGKTRRVMGAQLTKSEGTAPEAAPAAPEEPFEVARPSAAPASSPEPAPAPAEEPFEPVLPSATPAPAPEVVPEEETHETGTARRQALVESTPVNTMIVSSDGEQKFYKISDTQWQFNEGSLLTPTAVANFMALGERRGVTFSQAEGRPAEVNTPAATEVPATDAPAVGAGKALSAEETTRRIGMLRQLPTGTTIRPRSGEYTLTKTGSDDWSSTVDDGVYDTEDIYNIVASGREGGLLYEVTRPTEPTVLPTVTLADVPLEADSMVPPTVASRMEAFRRAPVGTTVTSPDGVTTWTKQADNEWVSDSIPGAVVGNSTMSLATDSDNGYWIFNKTGPAEPEGVNITAMTATDKMRAFRQAPIGSKLVSTGGKVITKMGDRLWTTDTGTDYQPADLVFVTSREQSNVSGSFGLILPETQSPVATAPVTTGTLPINLEERVAAIDALPSGSTVEAGGYIYTKDGDLWSYSGDSASVSSSDVATSGSAWSPGVFTSPATPAVGTNAPQPEAPFAGGPMSRDGNELERQVAELPDGARITGGRNNSTFIRREADVWSPEEHPDEYYNDSDLAWRLSLARDAHPPIAALPAEAPALPESPAAPVLPAINNQLPVGSFVPSAVGSKSGVKRVAADKWEMVKDGQPTGRFVNDEAVSVIQELVGTEVFNPRFGNNVGMYAEDLKLPGGQSLGAFLENGGTFGQLTTAQKAAINKGYIKFIDNLNTMLPEGFSAKLVGRPAYGNGSMETNVQFYKGTRPVGPASRFFRMAKDARTGKMVSSVEHNYWRLDDDVQGAGLSSIFLKASQQMYRQMGLDRITVHADISVGSYAWARAGFDFRDTAHMAKAMVAWETRYRDLTPPAGRAAEWIEGKREFDRLKALATPEAFMNGTHPPAIAFANIGRPKDPSKTGPEDIWFGKDLLQHTHWWGDYMLSSGTPSGTVAPIA